jgi:asparagine synthetase A
MVWIVAKKVFYHRINFGFKQVRIPIRVKFEFDVRAGKYVPDTLSFQTLYNLQPLQARYPDLNAKALDTDITKTVTNGIRYMQDFDYVPKDPHRWLG